MENNKSDWFPFGDIPLETFDFQEYKEKISFCQRLHEVSSTGRDIYLLVDYYKKSVPYFYHIDHHYVNQSDAAMSEFLGIELLHQPGDDRLRHFGDTCMKKISSMKVEDITDFKLLYSRPFLLVGKNPVRLLIIIEPLLLTKDNTTPVLVLYRFAPCNKLLYDHQYIINKKTNIIYRWQNDKWTTFELPQFTSNQRNALYYLYVGAPISDAAQLAGINTNTLRTRLYEWRQFFYSKNTAELFSTLRAFGIL